MAFPADKLTRIVAIRWGDNPFLALDSGGAMGTSDDGINWTKVEGYAGPILTVGAFGNDMFLAARLATGEMMKSSDGRSWESVPGNPFAGQQIWDIVFGNDRFLVVALDPATQKIVRTAVLTQDAEGNDVWSNPVSPPLSGSNFGYGGGSVPPRGVSGAAFSAGQFILVGSEQFTETFRDVIGYDFALNQPIYSSPYSASYSKSRLTRSSDGIDWGGLEDPFKAIDGGTSGTITITDPAPPHSSVTIPKTDPDVSQSSTNCNHIAAGVPDGGRVVVAQVTAVPGQSFAVYSGGAWSISPSEVRSVSGGLAYGTIRSGDALIDRFIARGTGPNNNLAFLTSPDGLSWQSTDGTLGNALPTVFGEELFVTVSGPFIYYSSFGNDWKVASADLGATSFSTVIY